MLPEGDHVLEDSLDMSHCASRRPWMMSCGVPQDSRPFPESLQVLGRCRK